MKLLFLTLLCALCVLTSHGAITSRVHMPRTATPREISLDNFREDNSELKQKITRHKRATPGNDSFSYTSALTNDNNGFALVHYSGIYSPKIFIVTQKHVDSLVVQSNLWRTTNFGREYTNDTNKLPADAIINYFYISTNKERLILTDQRNNRIYRTLNGGDNYLVTNVPFDPTTITFHPTVEDAVLAYDSEHKELHISSDFGGIWGKIDDGVHAYVWDPLAIEPLVYYETEKDNITYVWKASMMAGEVMKVLFDSELGAVETNSLILYNEFLFVEKQLNQSDTSGEGGLFVSYLRGMFREALFPLKTQEQHYLIADASQGQALVAVYHYDNLTNLYTSDAEGYTYSLSLQNVKGTGLSSWRNREASVELVMIEGIRGTYIANRLDPISDNPYNWPAFTQITYDKGGTWGFIKRPTYDSNGNLNDNCTLTDCNLNLRIEQPSRSGVYSNEHALGLIVAHGNSGKYIDGHWWGRYFSNVYLSRDAGFTWTEEFYRGSYEYSFLDHGGVIVAVSKYSGNTVYTKGITYSCTEGLSWQQRDISTENLYVIGMLTEPGSTTLEATVFAKTPGAFVEWLLIQLNFSVIVNVTCQAEDYVNWIPSDERQGGHCLLGEMATYARRKPEVCCFNGRDYERPINISACPCKLQDFDCDVGYEKLKTDSPCTPAEGTVPEGAPFDCPEGDNYTVTLGYRLIPGDKCEDGDYTAYAPRVLPCPIRAPTSLVLSPDKHQYRVGALVTILLAQGYGTKKSTVYTWDYGDGSTQEIQGFTGSETVTHTYTRAGIYTILLSASNAGGVNDISVNITVLDVVDSFDVIGVESPVSAGTLVEYSLTVYSPLPDKHVMPVGTYEVRWNVVFGTGSAMSISQDTLSYLLAIEGVYYISIEVFNYVSNPVIQPLVVNVVGVPGSLTLSSSTDAALLLPGQKIQLNFRQGTKTDFTKYSVDFGDGGDVIRELNYSLAENLQHSFSAPGVYNVTIEASNIAGTTTVARNITILDVVQSADITTPTIIIVGLNEVFDATYTLQYNNTKHTGTIMYSWKIGDDPPIESPTPQVTRKFLTASMVTIKLTVSNEVSSATYSLQIVIHPSAENLRIRQDGQTYPVNTKVFLNLETADSVELPREGVTYKWDTGEEGATIIDTALPTTTFQYATTGTKVVKVHSVSNSDGETINHVVSGTLYILSIISAVTSIHNTGTSKDSASVNFIIRDPYDKPYIGPVTVLISDDSHNDWAYNKHDFTVSDGSLELPLSPLIKYTVYKIKVTLTNVVSNVSTVLQISRVKEIEQNVIITFHWVDIPADIDVNEWERQVEDSVMSEIIDQFQIDRWRLSVELNIQEDKPYEVYVRLLPKNNTDEGAKDQLIALNEINKYFQHSHDITISGNYGNQTIPVIDSQITNGITNTVHVYTLIGLSVGLPIVLVLFIILIIPFVICGVIYARKYRKVSHAYSRLRQTRANNFMFTHDGLEDEDDEPPVNLGIQKGDKVKFDLDDNFERTGFGNAKMDD